MIIVKYKFRLGNKLFQYCLGKIFSIELNDELYVECIEGFPNIQTIYKDINYIKKNNNLNNIILKGHLIDFNNIIDQSPKNIDLIGFFQRYEYFKNYKFQIKSWLYSGNLTSLSNNSIVVHIRGGDVWKDIADTNLKDFTFHYQQPALPISYYTNILNKENYDKIYLVCEYCDDPILLKLKELYPNAIIHCKSIIEDFNLIKSAKNIIMSISTYCWWASWLSDAKKIHFPLAGFWHPKIRKEIDLYIDNEARYIYYDLEHLYTKLNIFDRWNGTTESIELLLQN